MTTVLFTGFPGFLGSALLPRVLARDPAADAVCLVQPRHARLANERAEALMRDDGSLRGRIRMVEGDIVQPDLGLAGEPRLTERITEIYHLAAIYDLSVARELAMRVNVEGTRHVIDLARRTTNLKRLHYVSTCYVSGRYQGRFTEEMLEQGQTFNNHYEETKYLAEVEVQRGMREGLPATIYRPAIVVGDSRTGETQKYDGPYFAMQWLLRQPRVALMPVVGDPTRYEFNVVPRDFVVDAIAALSAMSHGVDRVYQLADPAPLTVDRLLRELARATGRFMIRLPLPMALAKGSIDRVPIVNRILRIPSAAVNYFVHPTHYDTSNAQADLADTGIRCPRFPEYADRLVTFMREHPEVGAEAMT
jgi:thioester reductase-like protein